MIEDWSYIFPQNQKQKCCGADLVLVLCDDQVVEVDVSGEEEPAGVVVDEGIDQLENLVCWKKWKRVFLAAVKMQNLKSPEAHSLFALNLVKL